MNVQPIERGQLWYPLSGAGERAAPAKRAKHWCSKALHWHASWPT